LDDILKVKSLTDAEKLVLTKRADGMKNLEIADEMKIVPSRATQIYNNAVRKIKDYYDF
jgi:DNA-directed RNA polymerase specialized sigma subunit